MPKQQAKLILFDCEDERASLFDDISVFQQLPSNYECCLFWNKNNQAVTVKFDHLRNSQQVYLYPSDIGDTSKLAINTLTNVIGEYAYCYHSIIIVHGHDDIYNKVMKNFNAYYGRKIIRQRKIQYPTVQALQELFTELDNQNKKPNHVAPKPVKKVPPKASVSRSLSIPEQCCLKCSQKFKSISGLNEHIQAKHQSNRVYICACSFKCGTESEFKRHQRERREIIDNQGVISCLNTGEPVEIYLTPDSAPLIFLDGKMNACVFECHRRWFTPVELMRHLKGQHANQIDIRIRCCDDDIMYSMDGFRAHIESLHEYGVC
ncbi:unnamed protein product [Adineta steineri]|uniref:C2H2-type domain-containing protein n=1 Tax=Adineta steineri TaxID=433720 RepID=A0A819VKX2_9BILA|nr:unnamed protein product [Adineta steineri]CAF1506982.1 unnamed protein product [Adineta steineri]CAF3929182.1 unnamed protein product [Adineta steineri]CAF4110808.1 unnamed protein product [Adineta steineri]